MTATPLDHTPTVLSHRGRTSIRCGCGWAVDVTGTEHKTAAIEFHRIHLEAEQ